MMQAQAQAAGLCPPVSVSHAVCGAGMLKKLQCNPCDLEGIRACADMAQAQAQATGAPPQTQAAHSAAPAVPAEATCHAEERGVAQEPDVMQTPEPSQAPNLALASPQLQRYLEEQQQFAAQVLPFKSLASLEKVMLGMCKMCQTYW